MFLHALSYKDIHFHIWKNQYYMKYGFLPVSLQYKAFGSSFELQQQNHLHYNLYEEKVHFSCVEIYFHVESLMYETVLTVLA